MTDKTKAPAPAKPFVTPDKLPEAKATTGATCSLACNLPHGLIIIHRDRKLVVNGANHTRAIQTGTAFSARWGITHDVDEDWFDDWAATSDHPAVANGLIRKNAQAKIEAEAQAVADAIPTGTDQVDPDAPGEGVETRQDDE